MTSNLQQHDQLQNFVFLMESREVWHRAYGFADATIHVRTLAQEIKQATGISLMQEQEGDEVHGFLCCNHISSGVEGTCGWCLAPGEKGKPHTCIILTLFPEYVSEEPIVEEALTHILQDYHQTVTGQNISLPASQAT